MVGRSDALDMLEPLLVRPPPGGFITYQGNPSISPKRTHIAVHGPPPIKNRPRPELSARQRTPKARREAWPRGVGIRPCGRRDFEPWNLRFLPFGRGSKPMGSHFG